MAVDDLQHQRSISQRVWNMQPSSPHRRSFSFATLFLVAMATIPVVVVSQCGGVGCSPPIGEKWDRWDMAGSTYAYCYAGCHMDWFINNSATHNLSAYAGVVGVDHYWTGQGVPCVDGEPHEFTMQNNLAIKWKSHFPQMRFMSYRILSAVPYDMVIHNKIVSDPDYFVQWKHLPNSTAPGNGSVCFNYESPCFNDPHRINAPKHNCSFEIRAAAYNWLNPKVAEWWLEDIIYPSLEHCDGIWLDGNGYDNGAWMCSGICCGYGPENSPHNQPEIDATCIAQAAAATTARTNLIARGGFDGLNCFDFHNGNLPHAEDDAATCASKLKTTATWAANHSNYNAVVAYGADTGGMGGYNDTTAAGAVAAFMIMRGQHWFFSIGEHNSCNPLHYPVSGPCHSDGCGKPCHPDSNIMNASTAALLVTDYGKPLGELYEVSNQPHVFARKYEHATVTLDCNTFSGSFLARVNTPM